jgi:hypothetical protein
MHFPKVERFHVVRKVTLRGQPLDVIRIDNPDFIKIDIQGSELLALNGASQTLNDCLGLELEVEFSELYKGQSCFGDVDSYLKNLNFELIDFVNLRRWERKHFSDYGQLVFGDALYLRSPEFVASHPYLLSRWRQYLSILILYRKFDLVERCLELHPLVIPDYCDFVKAFKSLQRKDLKARKINQFATLLVRLLGSNYRTHLLH